MTPTAPPTFAYDGSGTRVKKTNNGNTTYYIGAHFEVIDGTVTKYIFADSMRVAMIKDGEVSYYHKDLLGSSTVMTDESGVVLESSNYAPFGAIRAQTGVPISNYNFTDQELDPETGLYFYNARYYDPLIGRFISPDTIVPDFTDPQTLNRYSYCLNNPLIYTDPSGHWFIIDDIIIAAIAIIEAATTTTAVLEAMALGAAFNGAVAAVTDGNIGLSMTTGAIGGALFFGAGEITGGFLEHAVAGAMSGGAGSAIEGGDIGMAMLTGAVSSGFAKYAEPMFANMNKIEQFAGRSLLGGATGGITAELYGADFKDGFQYGATTAGFGVVFNDMWEHIPKSKGINHKDTIHLKDVKDGYFSLHDQEHIDALTPMIRAKVQRLGTTYDFYFNKMNLPLSYPSGLLGNLSYINWVKSNNYQSINYIEWYKQSFNRPSY